MLIFLILWYKAIRLIKRLAYVSLYCFLLISILLQFKYVQNFCVSYVVEYINKETGMSVSIGEIYLNWFNSLKIKNASIYDDNNSKMMDVEELKLKFSIFSLIFNKKTSITGATLKNSQVNFIEDENGINFSRFINKLSSESESDSSGSFFEIQRITLSNSKFTYRTKNAQDMPLGLFNNDKIILDSIYGDIYHFQLISDTIVMDVEDLRAIEINSGLRLQKIKTHALICPTSLNLDNLYLKTKYSLLTEQIRFNYSNYKDLGYFFEKISLDCHLANSIIDSRDLLPFAPSLSQYPFKVNVSGTFTGPTREIMGTDFSLCMGKNTYLQGIIELRNLPDINNTIFIFDFENSQVLAEDILRFVPKSGQDYVLKLGTVVFTADFYGTLSDFITDGVFETNLGVIETDFELKGEYQGDIVLKEFNLGGFLNVPALGSVSLSTQLMGSGFDLLKRDSVTATVDLTSLELLNYRYHNSFASFKFARNEFDGRLTVADTNLRFQFEGKVNFGDSTFDFRAKFDTLKFLPLHLLDLPIVASFEIDADFKGLQPDNIDGYLKITDIKADYENRKFYLKEFFTSITDLEKNKKRFVINSDLIRAKLEGNYSFTGFAADANQLFKNYYNYIFKQPTENSFSYKNYRYTYSVKLIEPDNFAKFINYPLRISNRSELRGYFEMDSVAKFSLNLKSDSISYLSNKLHTPDLWFLLEYDSSKQYDPYHFDVLFTPKHANFSGFELSKFKTTLFNIEKQTIFVCEVEHSISKDKILIDGLFEFENDSLVVVLGRDTEFSLLDNIWQTKGKNKFIYDWGEGDLLFDNILFGTQGQTLGINGVVSSRKEDKFSLLIKNFDLNALSPYVGAKLSGYINLSAELQDLYGTPFFIFKGNAENIKLQNFLLGDLTAQSQWDAENSHLNTELSLKQANEDLIKIKGYLDFKNEKDFLHLDMFLDNAPVQIVNPFVADFISVSQGTALGAIRLRGNSDNLKIKGDIFLSETNFKVIYSNVTYVISDRFSFDEKSIKFRNVRFKDDLGNVGRLDGTIEHHYFDKFKLNLTASLQNLKVLATKQTPYSLFYGTVFMSGTAQISGAAEHPDLKMDLKTERGTKVYMPLETSTTVEEQQDFVRFVKDSVEAVIQQQLKEKVSVTGFEMSLNLEIGSETFAEIMINKKTGDLIEVYGKGKLSIKTNSDDELTMFGRVEIETGKYRLSFINLISKEFDIRQPSSLSWSGDPLKADLNIMAVYRQNIPLIPILEGADSAILKTPEVRRRYPVETILFLKGDMMQPTVGYDIAILDYPPVVLAAGIPFSIDAQVSAFKQSIKNNEQELNRQVFSLLVLKTFSARNTFSGGNFAGGSIGELLANQLSYWVSQVDNNLEVDVDLQGLTREALNSARIRLSYTALGGRIRITREGTVAGQQAGTQSNVSSVVGDWVVEYMVKNDGSLRLKMYHRQNLSAFINTAGGVGTTTGVSFMHTKSFDLRRRRKNKLKD